jgi:hypothetical protein
VVEGRRMFFEGVALRIATRVLRKIRLDKVPEKFAF